MEKRKLIRVDVKAPAEIVDEHFSARCIVRNLSLTGMYLDVPTSVRFIRHETVTILVHPWEGLPRFPLRIRGRVVRCEEKGIALRYVKMDHAGFEELKKVIARGVAVSVNAVAGCTYASLDGHGTRRP